MSNATKSRLALIEKSREYKQLRDTITGAMVSGADPVSEDLRSRLQQAAVATAEAAMVYFASDLLKRLASE